MTGWQLAGVVVFWLWTVCGVAYCLVGLDHLEARIERLEK